jgi:hypothetical protein
LNFARRCGSRSKKRSTSPPNAPPTAPSTRRPAPDTALAALPNGSRPAWDGDPASGSAAVTGTRRLSLRLGAISVASIASTASDPSPLPSDEQVVEMLHGGLRVERHDRILDLLRADHVGDVPRDEQQRVADRELAAPHVDVHPVRRRQPPGRLCSGISSRAWRTRYASASPMAATYSSLRRMTAIAAPTEPGASPCPSRW